MSRLSWSALLAAVIGACAGGGGGQQQTCPAGLERCGDACVDLDSAAHCGSCGVACSASQICQSGSCGCAAGATACGAECVDLLTSDAHCGACGRTCSGGAACSQGECLAVCAPPLVACGLACADLSTNPASCGRCGRACAAGAGCAAGACAAPVCTGLVDLPGAPFSGVTGEALATGDLDGDGWPDIAAANNDAVLVAFSMGRGRFARAPDLALPAGAWASAVVLADLDGDGRFDLAIADRTGAVHLARGIGGGTFGPPLALPADSGADGIAAADLDGDGDLDLAVSAQGFPGEGSVTVLWNAGDGTFPSSVALAATGSFSDVAVADVNGDGRPDVLATEAFAGVVSVFLALPQGGFGAEQLATVGGLTQALALADLDGDGRLDLVSSHSYSGGEGATSVSLGSGDGTFGLPASYPVGANGLAVADLDGDGRLDVALATGALLLGAGDGTFAVSGIGAASMATSGIAAADLDGDGRPDLAYGSGLVALRSPAGGWLVTVRPSTGWPVGVGDVNGDLDPDLVVAEYGEGAYRLVSLLGGGDGGFASTVAAELAQTMPALGRLGDVDGDGRLDLVTSNTEQVAVWFGDGAGHLTAGPSFAPAAAVAELAGVDLDGDGLADLVTRDVPSPPDGGSPVLVRRGRGDGTFDPPALIGYATALAVLDLEGNGAPDLLLGNRTELSVDVLLGAGDGTFGPATHAAVGGVVTGIAAGDLDGDGLVDLVVAAGQEADPAGSFAARLHGLGGGALGPPVRFLEGRSPRDPLLADLDGDGRADLLVMLNSLAPLALLRNPGDGAFGAPDLELVGARPLAAVDLDRDGRPDVVAGGLSAGTLVLRAGCRP